MSMKLLESPVRTRVDPLFFFASVVFLASAERGISKILFVHRFLPKIELQIDLIYVAECVFEFFPRCELIFFVCISQVEQEVKVMTWITSLPHLLSLLPLLPPKNSKKKVLYCTNAVMLSL
jgi:hypothetical protein